MINKRFYLSGICCLVMSVMHAQVGGLSPYKFSADIYSRSSKDSTYSRGSAPTDLSFIGLYKEAIAHYDQSRRALQTISGADSTAFAARHRPVDARKFLVQKAKENQIVIFNEAHHNPRNRVFVASLLKDLRSAGYKYFAAETFINDSFFVKENHPILFTGYYTMEPQFGNLVREAVRLGFSLFPYEASPGANGKQREIEQARNIAVLLKRDPQAKVIIYCGYSHVLEDSVRGWEKAMAGRVREYTGIDPYTVDQIELSERSQKAFENPYFRLIKYTRYAVLVDSEKKPFNKRLDGQHVDALLYSPPTRYIHNRPGWIFDNGRVPYFLPAKDITVSFPVLVKAFLAEDDPEKAIAIDVIEIKDEHALSATALALPQGNFFIQLEDTQGKKQIIKIRK